MIQSGIIDSYIWILKKQLIFLFSIKSTSNPILISAFANAKLVRLCPNIQTVI